MENKKKKRKNEFDLEPNDDFLIKHLKSFGKYEETSEPAINQAKKLIKTIKKSDMRRKINKEKILHKVHVLAKTKNCDLCDTFQGASADLTRKWYRNKKRKNN